MPPESELKSDEKKLPWPIILAGFAGAVVRDFSDPDVYTHFMTSACI